jgi:hypothetical protein
MKYSKSFTELEKSTLNLLSIIYGQFAMTFGKNKLLVADELFQSRSSHLGSRITLMHHRTAMQNKLESSVTLRSGARSS